MERLKKIIAEILQIQAESITLETSPKNVESWDSFNGLMLVSELEREFSVSFSIEEITSVQSVKDIREALEKHGVHLS